MDFSRVKAVLFDCDGTLVDSEYAHYLGWQHALLHFNCDFTLDEYYQYVGRSAETIAKILAEKTGEDCHKLILTMKGEYYRGVCQSGVPPIPSTVDFLKRLAAEKESLGIKIGVCSAARKAEILSHLHHLQIAPLLDVVLSGQEDLEGYFDPEGVNKPKPYIYLHAMKQLGVLPAGTVVIEDSAPGVAAGVAAGCFTIAIPNHYTRKQKFGHIDLRLESFRDMDINQFLHTVINTPRKRPS